MKIFIKLITETYLNIAYYHNALYSIIRQLEIDQSLYASTVD